MKPAAQAQAGSFIRFPFRVYPEGGQFVSSCDALRVSDRAASEDAALNKLGRSLQLYVRISMAKDSLSQLFDKLSQAMPNRSILGRSTMDPTALKVDRDAGEMLVPMPLGAEWDVPERPERGGATQSMLD